MSAVTHWTSPASLVQRPLRRAGRPRGAIDSPMVGSGLVDSRRVFPQHCEEEFIFLARAEPEALVALLNGKLSDRPELLTFAAEAAGQMPFSVAIQPLVELLRHPRAVVREGAIYGLAPHLGYSLQAREALRSLVEGDPSNGVRDAAADALASLD